MYPGSGLVITHTLLDPPKPTNVYNGKRKLIQVSGLILKNTHNYSTYKLGIILVKPTRNSGRVQTLRSGPYSYLGNHYIRDSNRLIIIVFKQSSQSCHLQTSSWSRLCIHPEHIRSKKITGSKKDLQQQKYWCENILQKINETETTIRC